MGPKTGLLLVALSFVACGGGNRPPAADARAGQDTSAADGGGLAPDVAFDRIPDTTPDLAQDKAPDTTTDMATDLAPDLAVDQPRADSRGADGAGAPACPGDRQPEPRFCDPSAAQACRLSTGATCQCEPVCSGPRPLPGMDYVWICSPPPPAACPASRPTDGAPCAPEGLVCTYGFCSGWSARCVAGRWVVTFMPPPP